MSNIINTQGINTIRFAKDIQLYCPMGKDMYLAHINVDIVPDEEIMDYCETNAFLEKMDKAPYIIEDAVNVIYKHIEAAIKPRDLVVKIYAQSHVHMPVEVVKAMNHDCNCCPCNAATSQPQEETVNA